MAWNPPTATNPAPGKPVLPGGYGTIRARTGSGNPNLPSGDIGGYGQGMPGAPGGSGGAGTVDTSGGTAGQQDAFAFLKSTLDQYDLGTLAQWAWKELQGNKSADQILLELRDQPEFRQRFKVIFDRQAQGLPAISPADVINYENGWRDLANRAGLPAGMSSRDMAQSMLGNDISLAEAGERINQGYAQMRAAPDEVRIAFQSFFGANGDQALAAFFTDPDKALPDLERMVTESQIAGRAGMQGWQVDEITAQRLARAGVTEGQATQGFSQLQDQRDLFSASVGDTGGVSRQQGIEAEFGLSGDAQTKLTQLAAARRAAFEGRSEAATANEGIVGLGQARSV